MSRAQGWMKWMDRQTTEEEQEQEEQLVLLPVGPQTDSVCRGQILFCQTASAPTASPLDNLTMGYTGTYERGAAPHEGMSASRYLATRISTLKPPMLPVPNPWKLVRMLNRQQWAFFFLAFWAWTWDAFDFFTVSLTVSGLAKTFDKSKTDITWGITLVLMFRSVGSIIFGIAADRYGRKWPFIVNNLLFVVLELGSLHFGLGNDVGGHLDECFDHHFTMLTVDDRQGTGFCQTYSQFLACRALFGVAMGGLYGNAAATALEDLPEEARGLMSGMLQQGYAFGYLLCAAFARGLVNTTSHDWRPLYWFGACPPVLFIIWRFFLPETNNYQERQRLRAQAGTGAAGTQSASSVFLSEGKVALVRHWLLLTYLVLLMAGFNFMSHGSQDLYPTMLENQLGFSATQVTVTQVVANLGAMTGGTVVGFSSQSIGRRFSIIVCCIIGGALLYPYSFVKTTAIMAPAFFEQFCVQGAWGVIPIHLMELSPGAFRTFVVGTSYQLGNLVSSASSTIEARIGEQFPLPPTEEGVKRYEYGKVICIFMACVYVYVIILTLIGPEHLNRKFDVAHDLDAKAVVGPEAIENTTGVRADHDDHNEKAREIEQDEEKRGSANV
ncbi:sugar transporter family protein [Purpureocillium lavendulum]|uniref:Sugar transporter family protein n=1 Tax=Purpureocillium lavendulum TaxID=1247861 RepID=A0AB34FWM7_9HYPO|nr:sugar transporter family protein [Purpureocillium lavendulum]